MRKHSNFAPKDKILCRKKTCIVLLCLLSNGLLLAIKNRYACFQTALCLLSNNAVFFNKQRSVLYLTTE